MSADRIDDRSARSIFRSRAREARGPNVEIQSIGSPALWIGFTAFVLAMLALDLGVFHRKAHEVHIREALTWTAVWICLALIFNLGVYVWFGSAGKVFLICRPAISSSSSIRLRLSGTVSPLSPITTLLLAVLPGARPLL